MRADVAAEAAGLAVDVAVHDARWRELSDDIESLCRGALGHALAALTLAANSYEVSVVLTGDAELQDLNARFRGRDEPTNVLSFPATDDVHVTPPAGMAMPLGDIVIALDTMDRECAEQGLSRHGHFIHLLVHGMLHLAGYDHQQTADAEQMECLEVRILEGLGVSDPYTSGQPAEPA